MRPRLALALWLALCWLLLAPGGGESAFLGHAPPVVPTPWRKALLTCECANGTLDCSERGLTALDASARELARRCGGGGGGAGPVTAVRLFDNELVDFPDGLRDVRVVNATRNRLRALPRVGQVSAQATLLDFFDNHIATAGEELRHLSALRTLRLGRNRALSHLRFLPDPCGLVVLEVGENAVASLDGPLARCVLLETLDLSANALTSLPRDVLAPLRRLRVLDVSSNEVAPLPPDVFAHLTLLTDLRLDSTGLEALPDGIFDNLSRLEFLSLTANPFMQLSGSLFHGLNSLTFLSLDSTTISSLPESFGNLTSLEELHLSYIELTTIPRDIFATLPSLKLINLSNNNISSLPSDVFSGLSQLDTLILAYNPFFVIPSNFLTGLSSLQLVSLSTNLIQTPIPELINVPIVECFQCGITSLPSRSFSQWGSTKALSIHKNNIKTIANDAFVGLSTLAYLNFASNNISTIPASLFSPLHNLTRLYLSNNLLRVLPDNLFAGLSEITELALNRNDIYELPQHIFRDLRSLRRLDLSTNKLTTLPDGLFANLTALWELNVANNELAHLPVFPSGCGALRAVSFMHNNISHLDETALRSWLLFEENDVYLNLDDTNARIPLDSLRWVTALPNVAIKVNSEDEFGRTSVLIRRKRTLIFVSTSATSQNA